MHIPRLEAWRNTFKPQLSYFRQEKETLGRPQFLDSHGTIASKINVTPKGVRKLQLPVQF